MDPEYKKEIEILMEDIICFEASLIKLKNTHQLENRRYEKEKAHLNKAIKNMQHRIKILKQKGCAGPITDKEVDDWIEEEVEKEHKRWKNLTPQEKMKEHYDKMTMLQEAEQRNWYCS